MGSTLRWAPHFFKTGSQEQQKAWAVSLGPTNTWWHWCLLLTEPAPSTWTRNMATIFP